MSHEEKLLCHSPKFTNHAEIYNSFKLSQVLTLELSQCRKRLPRVIAFFPQASRSAGRCQHRLPPTRKHPVFVLACPTRPSCAGTRPQEVCRIDFAFKAFDCLLK